MELEGVHDAVDLELLVAARFFEDGEVAGVGGAGGVGRRRGGGRLGGEREREGEQGCGEGQAHTGRVRGWRTSLQTQASEARPGHPAGGESDVGDFVLERAALTGCDVIGGDEALGVGELRAGGLRAVAG